MRQSECNCAVPIPFNTNSFCGPPRPPIVSRRSPASEKQKEGEWGKKSSILLLIPPPPSPARAAPLQAKTRKRLCGLGEITCDLFSSTKALIKFALEAVSLAYRRHLDGPWGPLLLLLLECPSRDAISTVLRCGCDAASANLRVKSWEFYWFRYRNRLSIK